jgi:hypothetical protein
VVGEPVQQRAGQPLRAQHFSPLLKGQVAGHQFSVLGIQRSCLMEVATGVVTVPEFQRSIRARASLAGRPGLNRRANQKSHKKW